MTFNVGDLAVYPAHGVGRIEAIEKRLMSGQNCSFYVMRILENDMKIMIPTHNMASVGLRPVVSAKKVGEVYKLLKMPAMIAESSNWNRRQKDYMDKIKTGSLEDVAEVLRELLTMRGDKELSFGERKLLDTTRNLLVREVAVAKKVSEIEIEAEINKLFPPPKTLAS